MVNVSLSSSGAARARGIGRILQLAVGGTESKSAETRSSADEAYSLVRSFLRDEGASTKIAKDGFRQSFSSDPRQRQIARQIEILSAEVAEADRPIADFLRILNSMLTRKKVANSTPQLSIRSDNGRQIPMGALSAGEKHLLLILLQCMTAEENVALIDEPELSMHLDWQQRLVSVLATVNPRAQLILATHSPEIMAMVPEATIIEF